MRLIDLDAEHDYMLDGKYEVQRADYLKVTSKKTKLIKYYDDDEGVWKIGEVIVDE